MKSFFHPYIVENNHIPQPKTPIDLNTAFLHGDLEEEVYMKILPGLKVCNRNLVCKLKRSMYGLKQSSRQWNHKLTNTLISLGYCQSKSDYSLLTKKTDTFFTTILVYVDGLVLGFTHMLPRNMSVLRWAIFTRPEENSADTLNMVSDFLGKREYLHPTIGNNK